MRDEEDLIKIRGIPFPEVFYGDDYGLIGKRGETGDGNIGRSGAEKSLKAGNVYGGRSQGEIIWRNGICVFRVC